ncbi:MAG: sugar isomerase [Armatimonadetes bacterium 55-13]|nr:sugar isomerase [Armatimonadota bacterium]OJU65506.1 MAG: sugar isomerase [Armatimonadetes bacterium 55-13]
MQDRDQILSKLNAFEVETPSWGYADTGTRFGKFFQDAAAITIEDKLQDAGTVHRFTGCCPSVAVHVLWDFAEGTDPGQVGKLAEAQGVRIGSINPNLFQDQTYKFGSVCSPNPDARAAADEHVRRCIEIGKATGSGLLSLWFADGTNYPGQDDLISRKRLMQDALRRWHSWMPDDMTMLVEYKPFEPAFYHTDIADWGMSYAFSKFAGPQAKVLVDTGHHFQGVNIEHIVSFLLDEGMLGGFHFNDRKYADDDLTTGSIDPYAVFRIFLAIRLAEERHGLDASGIAYMVDQSHNLKPKIEAMIQTVTTAQEMFLKAQMVDLDGLAAAQASMNIVDAENYLREGFEEDVRPLLREWRSFKGMAAEPLLAFRESGYEAKVGAERKARRGDAAPASSYA